MSTPRTRISLYVGPKNRIDREDLPKYEASGEWVAEVKHDGEWCVLTIQDGIITSCDSRTGLSLGGAADLLHRRINLAGSGQLCGELVGGKIHLFDVYNWQGHDLRDLPLEERREALEMVFGTFTGANVAERVVFIGRSDVGDAVLSDRIWLVERRTSGFLAWYDDLLSGPSKLRGARAEGLVLKKHGSPLRAQNADGKVDFQIKCKPLSTVDYVVIGPDGFAEKGTPKIALGLWKNGKLVKCMSPTWPAGLDLVSGMVVEVVGAEVWPSGAVRHGSIKRIRTDKFGKDCTFEAAIAA